MKTFAVVGGGQAGLQIVDSLRKENFDGRLVIFSEENHLPYQRPPLSKKFLTGDFPAERLQLRPQSFFDDRETEVRLGCRIEKIDRSESMLYFDGGELSFDGLALCMGTVVNRLPVPGADLAGVYYLRTLEDTEIIRTALATADRVAIIGGGFIGLEVAASCTKMGKLVTVIEAQDRLMERAVTPAISDYFANLHRSHAVDLRLSAAVEKIRAQADGSIGGIELADGQFVAADVVIVGIGVHVDTTLAQNAGLNCDNGIVVDEFARTSDKSIVAAGDCARFPSRFSEGLIRLESVQNAMDQAKVAAATMMDRLSPYADVPWFWSDQYDKKLQMVGFSHGHASMVVRGDIEAGKFSIFYFDVAGKLLGVDSINDPASHMVGRRIIANETPVDPVDMANPDYNLKALLQVTK